VRSILNPPNSAPAGSLVGPLPLIVPSTDIGHPVWTPALATCPTAERTTPERLRPAEQSESVASGRSFGVRGNVTDDRASG
jgi:hypothetical protein